MPALARLAACAAAAALAVPATASADHRGVMPQPVDPGPFTIDIVCPFTVTIAFSGKAGEVDRPDGSVLLTSPGLFVTFTNTADPSKSVTLNISGTELMQPSGLSTFDGRSVIAAPDGLQLIVGTFNATSDDNGYDLIQSGRGTETPVCPMIA
jgi:hypothetical protein